MITEFRDGLPFSAHGFGVKRNVYVSGRINFSVGENGGIFRLGYLGTQLWNNFDLLTVPEASVFKQLFRLHVLIDGTAYRMEYNNTTHYPFGYRSECRLGGVLLQHELIADNDTIFHRIRVLDNPHGARVTARICQTYDAVEARRERSFEPWWRNFDRGTLNTVINDDGHTTRIEIGAAGTCIFKPFTHQFKAYLLSSEPAEEHLFYLTFNPEPGRELSPARVDRKFAEFEELRRQGARIESGDDAYDSALMFTPLLMHYLEVPDHPGAFRASPFYWVWGWDTMVHCDALIFTGYSDQVRRMLLFFARTADPEFGIQMCYATDLAPSHRQEPVPVQAFFLITIYHYIAATGDTEILDELRDFARLTARRIADALVPGVDLVRGRGYFPDYPQFIGLTRHDFSAINNSICYQGLRAWRELSGEFADPCDRLEKAIDRFFDEKEGMWVDSLDGDSLEQRRYYTIFGMFYVSPLALRPRAADHGRIADFMKRHLLSRYGIWMLPPDRPGFMADGGQIGEYFPAVDRPYWNMMNLAGDAASAADHRRIVGTFWRSCTYPEGETTDVANVEPGLYEDEPGMKQLFTAKSWTSSAVDLNLGLRWNLEGFSLNPLPGNGEFAIHGMRLRGKRVSFIRTGNGSTPEITCGKQRITAGFIPWDLLEENTTIRIDMR